MKRYTSIMKIVSWNVNGLRAVQKKGFMEWLAQEAPDVLCVQETKAHPSQLDPGLLNPLGYKGFFCAAERKGYSGVATFAKREPMQVKAGFGIRRFDLEGRVLLAEFPEAVVLNIYFPNGKQSTERLQYKLEFYKATLDFVQKLKAAGKRVVISGDYNTAHKPIDLARPKENENISGFLPVERAWIDKWIENGQIDIFRRFCGQPGQYTWWDFKTKARDRNIGWRIDYHFVTENLLPRVKSADILARVTGSDHCPIRLELE